MQIRRKNQSGTGVCRCFRSNLCANLLCLSVPVVIIIAFMVVMQQFTDSYMLKLKKSTDRSSTASGGASELHRKTLLRKTASNAVPSIIRQGSLNCQDVKAKVQSGDWVDPNKGQVFSRETITHPQFHISLHNQKYDEVRWKIMEEGKYYEDEVHERFVDILEKHPKSYVLDVGANIGYYTLLSAALGHNVVSFEPNPGNIMRLCDSLRLNHWNHNDVSIFQNAVADVHGEEMMLFAPRNPGQGFLKPLEDGGDVKTDEHQAKTTLISLDKFAEEQGWFGRSDFEITLLKVDVEGKEPQVIMGAPRLLASGLVKNVLTEGRRFGRKNLFESLVVLFEAGFTLKDPAIPPKGTTAKEHAEGVVEYYKKKLGPDSMRTQDLWWAKE